MADEEIPQLWSQEPQDPHVLKRLVRHLRLVWRLLLDRRVPFWQKVIPFASLVYLAFPADVLPDVLLGLGQLDDLAVIALGLKLFVELAPPAVVREHLEDLIAASYEWTIIDSEGEPIDGPAP